MSMPHFRDKWASLAGQLQELVRESSEIAYVEVWNNGFIYLFTGLQNRVNVIDVFIINFAMNLEMASMMLGGWPVSVQDIVSWELKSLKFLPLSAYNQFDEQ